MENGLELSKMINTNSATADAELARQVHDLPKGGSLSFPISWKGAGENYPGHAMVFEIEKEPDMQIMLRIFNLGSGVEYHNSRR
jgi:hypothetical protein